MASSIFPTEKSGIFIPSLWQLPAEQFTREYADLHYLKFPLGQGSQTLPSNLTVSGTTTTANLTANGDAKIGKILIGSTDTYLSISGITGRFYLGAVTTDFTNSRCGYANQLSNLTASNNTSVGFFALNSIGDGYNLSYLNSDNTAIGNYSQSSSRGKGNTSLGSFSMKDTRVNTYCTMLGYNTFTGTAEYNYSTCLGANSQPTADHQIMLGTVSETVVCPNTVTATGLVTAKGGVNTTTIALSYSALPTLSSTSIGYTYSSSISSITINNNDIVLLSTISNVPVGVWLVQYLVSYYNVVGITTNTRIKNFVGITSFGNEIAPNNIISFTVNDYVSATLSVVYSNTAVSNFQLNCNVNGYSTSISTYPSEGGYLKATRIA